MFLQIFPFSFPSYLFLFFLFYLIFSNFANWEKSPKIHKGPGGVILAHHLLLPLLSGPTSAHHHPLLLPTVRLHIHGSHVKGNSMGRPGALLRLLKTNPWCSPAALADPLNLPLPLPPSLSLLPSFFLHHHEHLHGRKLKFTKLSPWPRRRMTEAGN